MGRSLVCGVGHTDILAPHSCPFYSRWKGIIKRCYGKPRRLPNAYEGCTVHEEWLVFSRFKSWMEVMPWEGNHLDKDILSPHKKIYCPDTSVFVPRHINTLMSVYQPAPSGLPMGVVRLRGGERYMAMIRAQGGEKQYLGTFDTAEEAHKAWADAKSRYMLSVAKDYRLTPLHDERVYQAIIDRALKIKSGTTGERHESLD